MKIKPLHVLILFLSLLVFSNSCEKSIFDYRHKYIGEWNFKTIRTFWCAAPSLCSTDTLYYEENISFGDSENEIIIGSKRFEIDKNGQLSFNNQQNPVGCFSNKKTVSFTLSYSSPGSHTTNITEGHKK